MVVLYLYVFPTGDHLLDLPLLLGIPLLYFSKYPGQTFKFYGSQKLSSDGGIILHVTQGTQLQ